MRRAPAGRLVPMAAAFAAAVLLTSAAADRKSVV